MIQGDYYQLPTGRVAALDADTPFPPIDCALKDPNGLIAIGGDLSAARILSAYQQGIFPWFSEGEPILWWSPDPRMVLNTADFKLHRSLRRTLQMFQKDQNCQLRMDTAFEQVMRHCAQSPRQEFLYPPCSWSPGPEIGRAHV